MLANVQQQTIQPVLKQAIQVGSLIFTDEYDIYARLDEWGYQHKTVNHSVGEYTRDEDSDGFHEVHVNTMEGFWSLLRSWLRAASPRNTCRCIWHFSNSSTTFDDGAKRF